MSILHLDNEEFPFTPTSALELLGIAIPVPGWKIKTIRQAYAYLAACTCISNGDISMYYRHQVVCTTNPKKLEGIVAQLGQRMIWERNKHEVVNLIVYDRLISYRECMIPVLLSQPTEYEIFMNCHVKSALTTNYSAEEYRWRSREVKANNLGGRNLVGLAYKHVRQDVLEGRMNVCKTECV